MHLLFTSEILDLQQKHNIFIILYFALLNLSPSKHIHNGQLVLFQLVLETVISVVCEQKPPGESRSKITLLSK